MSRAPAATPLTEEEADTLLAPLLGRPIALAVSGGPDSMALMLLVAAWQKRHTMGPPVSEVGAARAGEPAAALVVTVDHGLRTESAAEAALVAREAARLGLDHRTLTWSDPKPATGIAEAARTARYRLIAELLEAEATGLPKRALVTAHHADDQAETLLMRLARGSGVQGLAAMRPETTIECPAGPSGGAPGSLTVLRPLLAVSKARLLATVKAVGVPYVVDPTNVDLSYERPRVRQATEALAMAGISAEALATSARRLARADAALAAIAAEVEARLVARVYTGEGVHLDGAGYVALPEELSTRLLARLIAMTAGAAPPPRLSELERLDARLRTAMLRPPAWRATLGGALVELTAASRGRRQLRARRAPSRRRSRHGDPTADQ